MLCAGQRFFPAARRFPRGAQFHPQDIFIARGGVLTEQLIQGLRLFVRRETVANGGDGVVDSREGKLIFMPLLSRRLPD